MEKTNKTNKNCDKLTEKVNNRTEFEQEEQIDSESRGNKKNEKCDHKMQKNQ